MPKNIELIDKILSGYRYTGAVILHPTFREAFDDLKPKLQNRLPFHYVEKGSCTISVDEKEYQLAQGDFIAILKGTEHRLKSSLENFVQETTLICGYFELAAGNNQPLVDSFPEVQVISHKDIVHSRKMKTVMQLLIDEVNCDLLGAKLAVNRLSDVFFTYVLRNILDCDNIDKGILAGLSDKQLVKALAAFHDNFHRQWTLDSLSQIAGLSRTRFIARFQKAIGLTPGTYMTQWRMNWAASQLIETDSIIYDIALSAGYRSDASFSRVFRQQFGVPPSEYRKLNLAS